MILFGTHTHNEACVYLHREGLQNISGWWWWWWIPLQSSTHTCWHLFKWFWLKTVVSLNTFYLVDIGECVSTRCLLTCSLPAKFHFQCVSLHSSENKCHGSFFQLEQVAGSHSYLTTGFWSNFKTCFYAQTKLKDK